jgi:hypothetical protein
MTRMGYLWWYFKYPHPFPIDMVSRVTCPIEAPSFRCESEWSIETPSLGSRQPPHIYVVKVNCNFVTRPSFKQQKFNHCVLFLLRVHWPFSVFLFC